MTAINSEEIVLKPSLIHGKRPLPIDLVASDSEHWLSEQGFF
jgi:hypothetical protein